MKLTAVVVMLITYVFFIAFFLYPQIKTFLSLNSSLAFMERQINFKEQLSSEYSNNISKAEALKSELEHKNELIPHREKHINSIIFISNLLDECEITENDFKIGETIQTDMNAELIKTNLNMRGTGKYANILELLMLIENAGEFYVIDETIISLVNEETDDFEIALSITVYGSR